MVPSGLYVPTVKRLQQQSSDLGRGVHGAAADVVEVLRVDFDLVVVLTVVILVGVGLGLLRAAIS